MSAGPSEKRKHDDATRASGLNETPRKRPLTDAFKSLSLQNGLIRRHEKATRSEESDPSSRSQATPDSTEDAQMRDPSWYMKNAHTVVVNSLDDDSDDDAQEEDAQFVVHLPGPIDTTYVGTQGIPVKLLERPPENRMVLYQGSPAEVVSQTWSKHTRGNIDDDNGNNVPMDVDTPADSVSGLTEDFMDLD